MAERSIKSINLLPEFFRTDKNSKFLSSTIDQLIQPPKLERIDGYVGSRLTPNYVSTSDVYITETDSLRGNYQLEPALVVKDSLGKVQDVIGIEDLTNQIKFHGGDVTNFDKLYRSNVYSYNPHIDFDKFVNFQEYYWLVNGPETVEITGTRISSTSTFSVSDNALETSFVFSPDGLTEDPLLILYRGNTYTFNVNSVHKFCIKSQPSPGNEDLFTSGVTNNEISSGQITIVVGATTPDTLYYAADDQALATGIFVVKSIDQDAIIDVEDEIIGKVNYTSGTGVNLTNGMKIRFGGYVYPESYRDKEFIVEGVGSSIKLVDFNLLITPESIADRYPETFDSTDFDSYPFDNDKKLPADPEYVTINRASQDLNSWSRYNRWFHKQVIEASAEANNVNAVYPNDLRARRPIIEFVPNIKLYNFGDTGIRDVQVIDTSTTDAFSIIEGTSTNYVVDGHALQQGDRVIFTADTDVDVRSTIFEVNYINELNRLELQVADTVYDGNCTVITTGTNYKGTSWWYNGSQWVEGQQHTSLNQAPKFDLFDEDGRSYSLDYVSTFDGNRIFGYDVGSGTPDSILGFPLKYRNSYGVGSYLFKNYFSSESIVITTGFDTTSTRGPMDTFIGIKDSNGYSYKNVWESTPSYQIPIIEIQATSISTSSLEIKSLNQAGSTDFDLLVYVNGNKLSNDDFTVVNTGTRSFVYFNTMLTKDTDVVYKIYTDSTPNKNGYYEPSVGFTNNPLNQFSDSLTLSQITDHVETMIDRIDSYTGQFPGSGNLRDLSDVGSKGRLIVTHENPLAFSQLFLGKQEHNLINAIDKGRNEYAQFKLALQRKISEVEIQDNPVRALDIVLKELNKDKDLLSSYYYSDMLGYGTNRKITSWIVSNVNTKIYPISNEFKLDGLVLRSVLVYINNNQLLYNIDYVFVENDSSIELLTDLAIGDLIEVYDYLDTAGSFVPSTPTKLGLYPKFIPSKFVDNSYVTPVQVIQGHDGSITVAYGDYRDDILLEFEKRIYNNLKVNYRPELFDINMSIPGLFRNIGYSREQINNILVKDFLAWAGTYGIEPYENLAFDEGNSYTFNYTKSYHSALNENLVGSWRAVYKYYFDTDRPHSHPWEMLGFTVEPLWWEDEYGPAPYTSGNSILWDDIEQGLIRQGSRQGIDLNYSRPGLATFLPVDDSGDLIDPQTLLASNLTDFNIRQNWKFGDMGPAETAWRKSSQWPFVVQKLLALTKPADYFSKMYDPYRLNKNVANQWVYGDEKLFLSPRTCMVHADDTTLTSGYSVYIVENGLVRNRNYVQSLKADLTYLDYNLFYKVGGFVSKDKLQIIIDAIDPTSRSPGAILPPEDYDLLLNVSNTIQTTNISGIIVQKLNGKFVVRGYDNKNPYFKIYSPLRTINTPTITIGGKSESYVLWGASQTDVNRGLTAADLTSAKSTTSGIIYEKGQIVYYQNNFYRVIVSHKSGTSFVDEYFSKMPYLPTKGGAVVQSAPRFSDVEQSIPYETEYETVQEVYDLILGYGEWLKTQGFVFDEYNTDLSETIDWKFTGKEFLYWTTQNWSDNSIITLSPFANKVKFKLANTVVDNIFNNFYDYSILSANGTAFNQRNLTVNRENGLCTIESSNTTDGIYFASLRNVQKEHAMVFNNTTMFNDTMYDITTGYRQRRIKLLGFRTKDWDGDFFSPGFVYDTAYISDWVSYKDYKNGDVVKFAGKYYSAQSNIFGTEKFDFSKWNLLGEYPVAKLLPNFSYKIEQFEDFYSLDIDNFDPVQEDLAQHLIGYTPRVYLYNVFTNPISQYKFYQGFIREKGTRNSVSKLAKASIQTLKGEIDYTEEWAFRVGHYGSFSSFQEIEIPLKEGEFIENPQIIKFDEDDKPDANDFIYYVTSSDIVLYSKDYDVSRTFVTSSDPDIIKLQTAGFVRLDDVTYTAYNENSLLDVLNINQLNEGDYVWIGFKNNGDWDVYRYTLISSEVVRSFMDALTANVMTIVTKGMHTLRPGDIISLSQFDSQVDGVYTVQSVPKLNQFTITFDTAFVGETLPDVPGLLFKFQSTKYGSFDKLPKDSQLLKLPYESKVWLEDDGSGKWIVYKKVNNYSNTNALKHIDRNTGWAITKTYNGLFAVSEPGIDDKSDANTGTVYVYNTLSINTPVVTLTTTTGNLDYGYDVAFDGELLAVGAPGYNSNRGQVWLYSIINTGVPYIINSVTPTVDGRFGESLLVKKLTTTTHLLMVGEPKSGEAFRTEITTGTSITESIWTGLTPTNPLTLNSEFGYSLDAYPDNDVYVVGAPGQTDNKGSVFVFTSTNNTEIVSPFTDYGSRGRFGHVVKLSDDGNYLFVGAPDVRNGDIGSLSFGKVQVYKFNGTTYSSHQTISNPVDIPGMKFGYEIDVNNDGTELVIGALGTNRNVRLTFNKYNTLLPMSVQPLGSKYVNDSDSDLSDVETTFDGGSTKFFDQINYSGTAYIYNRKNNLFKIADELLPSSINYVDGTGTNFGHSIALNDNTIYVGAPAFSNKPWKDNVQSMVYKFDKLDKDQKSWNQFRIQDDLVDVDTIRKITVVNSLTEQVIDYLDVVDPLKGRISGIADQDITYKSTIDPAVYSIGNTTTINDLTANWTDEHVGELWWDLSSVKYIWYEQGELNYRKNNWGKLFPGATIDIYEWVGSELLPSEWAEQADTNAGLTFGISGQPKHPDNSVLSVKQVYNSITNSFINVYYFWVKNKTLVPNSKNRRISAFQVASIIENPLLYGLQYATILDSNALSVSNLNRQLVEDRIHLNITSDKIKNRIPLHTEWMLMQEGEEDSTPNDRLETKLFDSLLGKDKLGQPVPDPNLKERNRYGIEIRPRQSMFKNRKDALRNLFDFVNDVLVTERIAGYYSFVNLNKKDDIPDEFSREYDRVVEDNEGLLYVTTSTLVQAQLTCSVLDGKINAVSIINSGTGYESAPLVTISSDTDAEIIVELNTASNISSATIVDPGYGFTVAPTITVRPYTVLVLTDSTQGGKWAKYEWTGSWNLAETQGFDTTLYWDRIDWVSATYNQFVDYVYTVDSLYELATIEDINLGEYVKVNDAGLGYFIILEKVSDQGTYGNGYDIVFAEKGTIKFKDSLWNSTLDNSEELKNILTALKENIFVNELKIYWNLFWFQAVKYSLTEQKLLDWAFKTSFINVTNFAGELGQPSFYKLQNSEFYEDYIREVKPYHTQIRSFTTNHKQLEISKNYITDFDLPATYDEVNNKFALVQSTDPEADQYPWKEYFNNYKFIVDSIDVSDGGSGYGEVPTVVIVAKTGDTGSGATAIAYIRSGAVYHIEVTNPGSGYTTNPYVYIIGGGSGVTKTAVAYARIKNNKVRSFNINLKFDRTSRDEEQGTNLSVTDRFTCNGITTEFVLSWLALADKTQFVVTLDDVAVLSSDYTVEYYKSFIGLGTEYNKEYNKIVFTNFIPDAGTTLKVTYNKNTKLLNAVDRIVNYYAPTAGMPGLDLGQLMSGIVYPGAMVGGLTFNNGEDNIRDSDISGGAWTTSTGLTATDTLYYQNLFGVDPDRFATTTTDLGVNVLTIGAQGKYADEIIIDGDGFITPYTSHAPEELLPGEVNESVSISVFTKHIEGAPTVISSYFNVEAGTTTTKYMSVVPANSDSVIVTYQNRIFDYTTTTNFTTSTQFTIDWSSREIILSPQSQSGKAGYTIISIGGGKGTDDTAVIDHPSLTVNTSIGEFTSTQLQSLAIFDTVKSAYVTVNGESITELTTSTDVQLGYMLTRSHSNNKRAAVNVYNLPDGENTITAWFFGSANKYFNEVNEETFSWTSTQTVFTLSMPPGIIEPLVGQVIVELDTGAGKKILSPPKIDYYEVLDTLIPLYDISQTTSTVRVYKNGVALIHPTEYDVSPGNTHVNILTPLQLKDVIAVVNLTGQEDYDLVNNTLTLNQNHSQGELRVITFNNHDDMLMRTETFEGNSFRRYKISRPALDQDYVWVIVNGIPLINHYDFEILDDSLTIQVSDAFEHTSADEIIIISISSSKLSDSVIGYRIFNDFLSRVHYKRLSKQNTTYLTRELYLGDKEIHVADSSVLSNPIIEKNIPGVIYIDGERIEYFVKDGNILKQLRRSTLCTAPALYSEIYSKVIDQGTEQNIPYTDRILRQDRLTTASITTYTIPVNNHSLDYTITGTSTVVFANKGIKLNAINTNTFIKNSIRLEDQVTVYYGGRQLRKTGVYRQVTTASYDSPVINFTTISNVALLTTSTSTSLPITNVVGTAYVVTATNQVWVYNNSSRFGSVNGYEYTGFDYLPPEFSLNVVGSNQTIQLNIEEGVASNILLTITKKEFDVAKVWNDIDPDNTATTISLIESSSGPARFLQARPAELPDTYYYGGDPTLTEDTGFALTDEDDEPLEEY